MDPILCVRTQQTTLATPIGQTLEFDFSSDCPAGGSVLAYGVGLAGFALTYEPDHSGLGLLDVSLMPSLLGSKVYATASAVLNDYDYDLGAQASDGPSHPGCFVQATALALIGTSLDPGDVVVLGNIHGISDGDRTAGFPIGMDQSLWGYVAGLSLAAPPGSGYSDFGALSYSVTSSSDEQGSMALAASATMDYGETARSLDLLGLSLPSAVASYEVAEIDLALQPSPDPSQGLSSDFTVRFSPPEGKKVVSVGLLQKSVTFAYPSDEYARTIQASYSGPNLASPVLSGTYQLNMYDSATIGATSSASVYAIAQFG